MYFATIALAMLGIAILPTLVPLLIYALKGRAALNDYMFANYISVFHKQSFGSTARWVSLSYFLIYATPLIAVAARGVYGRRSDFAEDVRLRLLIAWLVAAVGGWVLIPNFFDHYALPVFVPLSVISALGFGLADGTLYLAAYLVCAFADGRLIDWYGNRRAIADYSRLSATVDSVRQGGCLFVADGPMWLYQTVPACRLTRFLFPGHLTAWNESTALGINQRAELARVLALHPAVIVTRDEITGVHNPPALSLINGALMARYRRRLEIPGSAHRELRTTIVWQRRDLSPLTDR